MPEITIYITNKNYGKYINQSINSALRQNFKNFELLIIDDGSTDKSKKIIEKYRKKKNVRIFYRKSKGLLKNINFAIKASRGKFIFRLDADDYLDPNALMILYKKIKENKEIAMVYSDYYLIDSKGNFLNLNRNVSLEKHSTLKDIPAHGACSLIRKICLEEVGSYDSKIDRQDGFDIWFKFLRNYKIKNVNLPLFYYRQHDNNLTKNQNKLLKTRYKITKKFIKERNLLKDKNIAIVIPVRGKTYDSTCLSMNKLNGKSLIYYTIDQAIKCNFKKKIILTTSDQEIIQKVKKRYKSKVKIHKREKKLSFENVDMKQSVVQSISKFYNRLPDILVILAFQNPLRESFYIEKAVNTLLLNSVKVLFSVKKEISNNYFLYGRHGLKSIRSNEAMKLEREAVYKQIGGISVYDYKEYYKSKSYFKKPTGHILIDDKSSFEVKSNFDLEICKLIIN